MGLKRGNKLSLGTFAENEPRNRDIPAPGHKHAKITPLLPYASLEYCGISAPVVQSDPRIKQEDIFKQQTFLRTLSGLGQPSSGRERESLEPVASHALYPTESQQHQNNIGSGQYGATVVSDQAFALLGDVQGNFTNININIAGNDVDSDRNVRLHQVFDGYTIETVHTFAVGGPLQQRGASSSLQRRWDRKEDLGAGTFGEVHREQYNDVQGQSFSRAVKVLRRRQLEKMQIDYKRELDALIRLSKPDYHHLFVEFFSWYEHRDCIFIAMEYIPSGDLEVCIQQGLHKDDVKKIATQILDGIYVMHALDLVHRDLKPANIFVVDSHPWHVKIGDFGVCKATITQQTTLHTSVGTDGYKAPEVLGLVSRRKTNSYSEKCDMWSYGCIVFQMLTGELPFPTLQHLNDFCSSDAGRSESISKFMEYHADAWPFVSALLQPQPDRRISASRAQDIASHWLHSLPAQRNTDGAVSKALFHGQDQQHPGSTHYADSASAGRHYFEKVGRWAQLANFGSNDTANAQSMLLHHTSLPQASSHHYSNLYQQRIPLRDAYISADLEQRPTIDLPLRSTNVPADLLQQQPVMGLPPGSVDPRTCSLEMSGAGFKQNAGDIKPSSSAAQSRTRYSKLPDSGLGKDVPVQNAYQSAYGTQGVIYYGPSPRTLQSEQMAPTAQENTPSCQPLSIAPQVVRRKPVPLPLSIDRATQGLTSVHQASQEFRVPGYIEATSRKKNREKEIRDGRSKSVRHVKLRVVAPAATPVFEAPTTAASAALRPPGKGPKTFAEMGIPHNNDDKDCVIM